jgi:predicted enzyme related to lactoylglutathione lyase
VPHPSPARGLRRFELSTPDPEPLAEHYRDLFGWIVLATPGDPDPAFDCWVGDRLAATIRPTDADHPEGWQVVFGGGGPARGATAQPLCDDHGVHAAIDPGRNQHGPWAPPPRWGEPCWTELATHPDAQHYWTDHLGWHLHPDEGADHAVYRVGDHPHPIAGHRATTDDTDHTGWTCYFAVPDLALASQLALALGDTVTPGQPHPAGHTAILTDPAGHTCALLEAPERWGGAWPSQTESA